MDNVQKYYLASVESADFISAAEESRKMINSWVESQTNGRLWESHSLQIPAESPLCVNTVLDPDRALGTGGGPAGGGRSTSCGEKRPGCSQDQALQAQLGLEDSVLWIPSLRSNIRLSHKFSFKIEA